MDKFNRELAPISSKAWELIFDEAKNALSLKLAGRKVVDFTGPLGWDKAAVKTGEVKDLTKEAGKDISIKQREVLPLIEVQVPFKLSRKEFDLIERGGNKPDLTPVVMAANKIAETEEKAIFAGLTSAGIKGIVKEAHASVNLASEEKYPEAIAVAISKMHEKAVSGPFSLVLGTKEFNALITATHKSGRPLVDHVADLVDGGIVKAPFLDGVFLISKRGGDFEFISGQDISIGYHSHDDKNINFYIEESFTFRVITPEAVVVFNNK